MSYDEYTLPDDSETKNRHFKWTPREDNLLRRLVNKTKVPNWNTIAKRFKNRNPRQCKDRWNYYLSPNVNNSAWTAEEDALLYEKYAEFGSKWSAVAKFFQGRTNTNVKNRWLALNRQSKRNKDKQSNQSATETSPEVPPEKETVNETSLVEKKYPIYSSEEENQLHISEENPFDLFPDLKIEMFTFELENNAHFSTDNANSTFTELW